ncbi:MAG: hypothetical protein M0R73_13635 [Dehalococcoidia bacterium]|nr:hypothetical protein [Dehalococcoidia bacterium]
MVTDRTAVLILRAWAEPHGPSTLRASARYSTAAGRNAWRALNLHGPEAIAAFVHGWLLEVEADAARPPEDGRGIDDE